MSDFGKEGYIEKICHSESNNENKKKKNKTNAIPVAKQETSSKGLEKILWHCLLYAVAAI